MSQRDSVTESASVQTTASLVLADSTVLPSTPALTCLPQVAVARARAYPPRLSAFTEHFWLGLAAGQWQSTGCQHCGKLTFPPKQVCPHCWGQDMVWCDMPTQGVLYSWTRIHAGPAVFAEELPYAVGIIDLDGGLRIATRLLDDENLPFCPGMRMDMLVLAYTDGPLLAARPQTGQ